MLNWLKKNYRYRFILYIFIIGLFFFFNLTEYDRYIIVRNPMIFLQTNWFEIVTIWLLLAILYKIQAKK